MTNISPTLPGAPPAGLFKRDRTPVSLFDSALLVPAISASFVKLDPRTLVKNPVMFCVEIVSVLTTIFFLRDLITGGGTIVGMHALFSGQITIWLWFTVLFANFAEAVAEGRGKAQADTLRRTRTETKAKRIPRADTVKYESVAASSLRQGDLVLVETGDIIPSDGEVIEGVASVDESAITGESAPVIRESGGDRSAVTGGTRVTSDSLKVRITAAQGSTFLDRMIALVEGAVRQKTPNEIALNILLAGMTIIFVFATVTIPSFAAYAGGAVSVVVLIAPVRDLDPDDHRRAAVGDRHRRHGPAGALQRARHVGPRGRGGGRRRHAAARQDRHDHARQPPGDRVHPAPRRRTSANWPTRRSFPRFRRDAGGPLDRRAREGEIRAPRPRDGAAQRAVHPVLGADADERRRCRGPHHPQGRGRGDPRPCRAERSRRRRSSCRSSSASRARAARRSRWRRTTASSASSISRTSSRAASASASPNCARWASAR